MLIQGKLLGFGDDLTEAMEIRRRVYVEELGIPQEMEFDELDSQAIHVIVYEEVPDWNDHGLSSEDKKPVATGRITYDGSVCEIGHVAVLKEYRGMKYGDFTVRMLLNKAFTSGIPIVTVNSKDENVDFYQKIGFQGTGESFSILGNKYCKMEIRPQNIATACNKCKNI